MLSNLANYLLGYGEASNRQEEPREADIAPIQRLISETEDDDWVVVNKPGEEGDAEGLTGMEESWFVTPPPCFASTGPVSVETSPLENLLIEHPSMSVYRRNSPGSLRRTSPTYRDENRRPLSSGRSTQTTAGAGTRPAGRVPVQPPAAVVREAPARPANRQHRHPLHQLVQQQQVQLLHRSQKVENRCKGDSLKKNHMERTNKVREVRNKRQRRSDRQNKHSGANNNRKCC